jgi:hypothetical protein
MKGPIIFSRSYPVKVHEQGGLGNEVPFSFAPSIHKEAPDMERLRKQLVNKLGQSGFQVLDINPL